MLQQHDGAVGDLHVGLFGGFADGTLLRGLAFFDVAARKVVLVDQKRRAPQLGQDQSTAEGFIHDQHVAVKGF